jgi:hypothetical protein
MRGHTKMGTFGESRKLWSKTHGGVRKMKCDACDLRHGLIRKYRKLVS